MDRGRWVRPYAIAWRCKVALTRALVMRASSKMNVNVAWSDREWNEEKVEYQTYPRVEKGEADSNKGDHWPN